MDMLDFALNMELEGEAFYLKLAKANQDNSLFVVFSGLAKEEHHHADMLKTKQKGLSFSMPKMGPQPSRSVFSKTADFLQDRYKQPEQIDLYRAALEKEKQSIELYTRLQSEYGSGQDLFTYLIAQEKEHFRILEDIVRLVNRPNDWVEAAEFGRREEY